MSNPQYPQGPGPEGNGQFNQPQGQAPWDASQGAAPQNPGGQAPWDPTQQSPQAAGNFQEAPHTYPQGGGPMPEAPKKSNPLAKLLPMLLVGALVIGGLWALNKMGGGGTLKVGNCITLTKDGSADYKEKKADCNSEDFTFTIVKETKTKSDCTENYSTYTVSKGSKSTYYCLMDNWQPNKCYKKASGNKTGDEVVACTDPSAEFKIAKREEGKADETLCTSQQKAAVFEMDPKRTYCLAAPK